MENLEAPPPLGGRKKKQRGHGENTGDGAKDAEEPPQLITAAKANKLSLYAKEIESMREKAPRRRVRLNRRKTKGQVEDALQTQFYSNGVHRCRG